jgi:hypothetical protein
MDAGSKVRWLPSNSVSDTDTKAVSDWIERTLPKLPSLFGQLVSLATCRAAQPEQRCGIQSHFLGDKETERALQKAQRAVFFKWLRLSIEEQKTDLEVYANWSDIEIGALLQPWLHSGQYLWLVPEDASEPDRQLFLSDLDLLLELRRKELGETHCPVVPDNAMADWGRRHTRHKVNQQCRLVIPGRGRIWIGVTENISPTGVLIRWNSPTVPPRIGDSVLLEIETVRAADPRPGFLTCSGTVARVFMEGIDTLLVAVEIRRFTDQVPTAS